MWFGVLSAGDIIYLQLGIYFPVSCVLLTTERCCSEKKKRIYGISSDHALCVCQVTGQPSVLYYAATIFQVLTYHLYVIIKFKHVWVFWKPIRVRTWFHHWGSRLSKHCQPCMGNLRCYSFWNASIAIFHSCITHIYLCLQAECWIFWRIWCHSCVNSSWLTEGTCQYFLYFFWSLAAPEKAFSSAIYDYIITLETKHIISYVTPNHCASSFARFYAFHSPPTNDVMVSILQLIMTGVAVLVVDRLGRRPLLIGGVSGIVSLHSSRLSLSCQSFWAF